MAKARDFTHYHRDGSVWATGQKTGDVMTGYWMWFRKDGTLMRSGSFTNDGEQTGEWTTYDKKGKVYKVTAMKPKGAAKKNAKNRKAKVASPKKRVAKKKAAKRKKRAT